LFPDCIRMQKFVSWLQNRLFRLDPALNPLFCSQNSDFRKQKSETRKQKSAAQRPPRTLSAATA
ncbi:hypothetical protein, partial [Gulosibacter hominis]|uniref:hypothetical protein n=1 Tax=Gulosibacter hominis TaxID=2770504 RepID=UPI001E570B16